MAVTKQQPLKKLTWKHCPMCYGTGIVPRSRLRRIAKGNPVKLRFLQQKYAGMRTLVCPQCEGAKGFWYAENCS